MTALSPTFAVTFLEIGLFADLIQLATPPAAELGTVGGHKGRRQFEWEVVRGAVSALAPFSVHDACMQHMCSCGLVTTLFAMVGPYARSGHEPHAEATDMRLLLRALDLLAAISALEEKNPLWASVVLQVGWGGRRWRCGGER